MGEAQCVRLEERENGWDTYPKTIEKAIEGLFAVTILLYFLKNSNAKYDCDCTFGNDQRDGMVQASQDCVVYHRE